MWSKIWGEVVFELEGGVRVKCCVSMLYSRILFRFNSSVSYNLGLWEINFDFIDLGFVVGVGVFFS